MRFSGSRVSIARMRTKTLIALPMAAGLALGGASLATGADDPPKPAKPPKPVKAIVERPALVGPPAMIHHGGPFLPDAEPFGLHKEIAEDMARELGLPADRVAEAMKKAIGAQFDRRRDEALQCFDDRDKCKVRVAPRVFRRP